MTYSWAAAGERKRMPYENPRGRRVNVLAAYAPYGPAQELVWEAQPRTLNSDDLLVFLVSLVRTGQPATVVLDNGSIYVSRKTKDAQRWLARRGIKLLYLPAYSPEVNAIERVLRRIKHHEMPERTYLTTDDLTAALTRAFHGRAAAITAALGTQLRELPSDTLTQRQTAGPETRSPPFGPRPPSSAENPLVDRV